MNAAGGALGVLIGGLLTQYAGWRWVMFVNVPMAAVALALVWRGVAAGRQPARGGRPDVLGAALATAGMVTLVFGVVRTGEYGWTSPVTVATLAAAVALLFGFVLVERTTGSEPLVRLGLFANRSVAGANAYNLLLGGAMASSFYFMSLYLQRVLGNGPALTGVEFLPFALGVVAGSVLAVRLGYRLAPRTLLIAGGLLTAVGFAWFALISPDGSFLADVLGPSILASVGFGLCLGPVVSTATAGVAARETGTAAGLLNSSRQIGASLGLAALGTAAQYRSGSSTTPAALDHGYALGLALSAALLLAAVAIATVFLPGPADSVLHERTTAMTTTRRDRSAVVAMYAGLVLTVATTIVPYVDHATANVLAAHIRDGYPSYTHARIDSAATTYLVCLSALRALGVIAWLATIRAARKGRRWVRVAASATFVVGTGVALFDLLVRDTSGDTGLPPLLGWVGLLPCAAGLVAVALLWRRPAPTRFSAA